MARSLVEQKQACSQEFEWFEPKRLSEYSKEITEYIFVLTSVVNESMKVYDMGREPPS